VIRYTVIGGWLGSGKTTLINRLLASTPPDGERIAVIVNDVGEINVDAALIRSRGTETIELTNGCVCCSIGGSLAITLRDLVRGDGRLGHRAPDRIIVEASGVADPAKVAGYGDRRVLRLDGVVVTVDCVDLERRLADETYGPMVRHQIDTADVLVATKKDLATPKQLLAAHDWCRANVRDTPVVEFADLVDTFAMERSMSSMPSVGSKLAPQLSLVSRTWRPDGAVDIEAVLRELADLGIVRAKGIIRDLDGVRQLVQHTDGAGSQVLATEADVPEGLVLIATSHDLDAFFVAMPGSGSR